MAYSSVYSTKAMNMKEFSFHYRTPLYRSPTPVLYADKSPHKFYFEEKVRWDAHDGHVVCHIPQPLSKIDIRFHHPIFVLHDNGMLPERPFF